jgi:hypothetical protein
MTVAKVYGKAMQAMVNKQVDFDSDTIKVALLKDTYTPNQDTHDYYDDLTNELTGGGYALQTLTSKTVTYDSGTNKVTFDCADVTFAGLTATGIRYAVFFGDTGSGSTSPLLCYMDFEANQDVTDQDFILIIGAGGLITLTTT